MQNTLSIGYITSHYGVDDALEWFRENPPEIVFRARRLLLDEAAEPVETVGDVPVRALRASEPIPECHWLGKPLTVSQFLVFTIKYYCSLYSDTPKQPRLLDMARHGGNPPFNVYHPDGLNSRCKIELFKPKHCHKHPKEAPRFALFAMRMLAEMHNAEPISHDVMLMRTPSERKLKMLLLDKLWFRVMNACTAIDDICAIVYDAVEISNAQGWVYGEWLHESHPELFAMAGCRYIPDMFAIPDMQIARTTQNLPDLEYTYLFE